MASALSGFGLGAGVKERAQPVACTAVQAVHAADCALCRSPLSGVSVYSVVPVIAMCSVVFAVLSCGVETDAWCVCRLVVAQ